MMFMYNNYYLEITPDKDIPNLLNGECSEAGFFHIDKSYDATIEAFKKYIEEYLLTKKEVAKAIIERDKGNYREELIQLAAIEDLDNGEPLRSLD